MMGIKEHIRSILERLNKLEKPECVRDPDPAPAREGRGWSWQVIDQNAQLQSENRKLNAECQRLRAKIVAIDQALNLD